MSNYTVLTSKPQLLRLLQKGSCSVLYFKANWCNACEGFQPEVLSLANANPEIQFIEIDVNKFSKLSDEYEIDHLPTTLVIEGQAEKGRVVGASVASVEKLMRKPGISSKN